MTEACWGGAPVHHRMAIFIRRGNAIREGQINMDIHVTVF